MFLDRYSCQRAVAPHAPERMMADGFSFWSYGQGAEERNKSGVPSPRRRGRVCEHLELAVQNSQVGIGRIT